MSEHIYGEFYLGSNYWYTAKDIEWLTEENQIKRKDYVHTIEYSSYTEAISRAEKAERKLEAAELKIMWLQSQRNHYLAAFCAVKNISDEEMQKKADYDDEFLKMADKKLETVEGEK